VNDSYSSYRPFAAWFDRDVLERSIQKGPFGKGPSGV
jgi:hypothetical protein